MKDAVGLGGAVIEPVAEAPVESVDVGDAVAYRLCETGVEVRVLVGGMADALGDALTDGLPTPDTDGEPETLLVESRLAPNERDAVRAPVRDADGLRDTLALLLDEADREADHVEDAVAS